MSRRLPLGGAALAVLALSAVSLAQTGKPPADEATLAAGEAVYGERCWFCHGEEGDGEGPVAAYLDPRPRDFTLGTFKLRTTESGELPTDEDLFRVVNRGIPGTAMPAWETYLSEAERWAVVRYIQTFAYEFSDPEFDPYEKLLPASDPVPVSESSIERGREVFREAKCFECHGEDGRGDGQKAASMEDDWGYPLRIRNLTKGWTLKGGTEPEDIFMRLSSGINGTPMPAFAKTLSEEDRWHLANFVSRRMIQSPSFDKELLAATRIDGELPTDPWDPRWEDSAALDIPMAGQLLAAPRWQNHAVEMVTLRALYNASDVAFLLAWDDRFEDRTHSPELELTPGSMPDTYAEPFSDALVRQPGNLRDAVALQLPATLPPGAQRPHFFRGGAGEPVQLWLWEADREASGKAVRVVEARGYGRPTQELPEERQVVSGSGLWKAGQWRVVMKRSLNLEEGQGPQLLPGARIPVAVEAWDGSNGEHGLLMSLSTWHTVYLEPPPRPGVAGLALLGVLMAAAGEWWIVRRLRRK